MQKFKETEITALFCDIMCRNIKYCGIRNNHGVGLIYKTASGNIGWQYYGQSAEEPNNRNLRWLLETIFAECETIYPAMWSAYHVNYIPIDPPYKGVDMSRSHPNVYGV